MVGVPAHVVGVNENMGVDVDQAGGNIKSPGADRAPRLRLRQRRPDLDDLAAGNADILLADDAGSGIEHVAVLDQKVVFHRNVLLATRSPSPRPSPRRRGEGEPALLSEYSHRKFD